MSNSLTKPALSVYKLSHRSFTHVFTQHLVIMKIYLNDSTILYDVHLIYDYRGLQSFYFKLKQFNKHTE